MDNVFNIENNENFKLVAEEIINNLFNKGKSTNTIINETIINTAKGEIREIIIKSNCDTQKIHELLLSKGYEEDKINFISALINHRKDELLYLTLVNYNSSYGKTVTKFDWNIKLIYGTSELKTLRYPSFQLILTTVNEGEYRQMGYDMSKDMLNKMISVLENIDKT